MVNSVFQVTRSKEETLAFIDYLKHKDKIHVSTLVEEPKAPSNNLTPAHYAPRFDSSKLVADMLKYLHDCPNALSVYEKFASDKAKLNSNHKIIPGFSSIYLEDEIEYLMTCNFSESEATTYAELINRHAFIGPRELQDPRFTDDFRIWACTVGASLYRRDVWFDCFADEYISYLHRFAKQDDTAFTVTESGYSGSNSRYWHEFMKLESGETRNCSHIILGYHASSESLPKDKIIAIAKNICIDADTDEVWIKEMDESRFTVVRRER